MSIVTCFACDQIGEFEQMGEHIRTAHGSAIFQTTDFADWIERNAPADEALEWAGHLRQQIN